MKVFMCDSCGNETEPDKLRSLHTHGPTGLTAMSTRAGIAYGYPGLPVDYTTWDLCPRCWGRTIESIGWYREYRRHKAAEEAAGVSP
jgi:hypothetical protein